MNHGLPAALAREIERKGAHVKALAQNGAHGELDRLRDETASLQALIAEATRMHRIAPQHDLGGAAMLAPVLIGAQGFLGFGLVSSLTPQGLRACVKADLEPGEPASVQLSSSRLLKGTVVWSRGSQVSLQFDAPIDLDEVLTQGGGRASDRGRPRPTRLATRGDADLMVGPSLHMAEISDISQQGCKLLVGLLGANQEVGVRLGFLDERPALVKWSRPGMAGLSFRRPLSYAELAPWGSTRPR